MLRFFHIPSCEGWDGSEVGYTVGYTRKDKETLVVTFARCGEKDQFSKKVGRSICRGRFEKGQVFELDCPEGSDKYQALNEAVRTHEAYVASNYGN